jgi:hypothetical protein
VNAGRIARTGAVTGAIPTCTRCPRHRRFRFQVPLPIREPETRFLMPPLLVVGRLAKVTATPPGPEPKHGSRDGDRCAICRTALTWSMRGRPPTYCGLKCRRAAASMPCAPAGGAWLVGGESVTKRKSLETAA